MMKVMMTATSQSEGGGWRWCGSIREWLVVVMVVQDGEKMAVVNEECKKNEY